MSVSLSDCHTLSERTGTRQSAEARCYAIPCLRCHRPSERTCVSSPAQGKERTIVWRHLSHSLVSLLVDSLTKRLSTRHPLMPLPKFRLHGASNNVVGREKQGKHDGERFCVPLSVCSDGRVLAVMTTCQQKPWISVNRRRLTLPRVPISRKDGANRDCAADIIHLRTGTMPSSMRGSVPPHITREVRECAWSFVAQPGGQGISWTVCIDKDAGVKQRKHKTYVVISNDRLHEYRFTWVMPWDSATASVIPKLYHFDVLPDFHDLTYGSKLDARAQRKTYIQLKRMFGKAV
ncbi:hypothetical protein PTSG_12402 [Salpingoeca rosetta]|uniref:Uncharacterized protein n=1 Tax=Salpingoeca rosetta (strain ATCC 50818 / BSB-021) TaxID=946362 RepID=F2UC29_SALR5|nr:uncharacterized protein PTSG_12402 [Salpingoeca rosetta]EGD74136.1 hypothetical protein PTSG_12402 [Salpingoeca rosetta]|eukprot:XP_004993037.1 hypothetical protein PTSG_12402 [Salpingoeca rosetta]